MLPLIHSLVRDGLRHAVDELPASLQVLLRDDGGDELVEERGDRGPVGLHMLGLVGRQRLGRHGEREENGERRPDHDELDGTGCRMLFSACERTDRRTAICACRGSLLEWLSHVWDRQRRRDVSPALLAVELRLRSVFLASRSQGAWCGQGSGVNAVEVRDLEKVFTRRKGLGRKRRTALKGVTFTMERGECVAILGQNGSGKSTLVRLLSTLLLAGRRRGADLRLRRVQGGAGGAPARQPRVGRGELLQEDERGREPRLRGAVLRHGAARDAREDPDDPRAGRLPRRRVAASRWRTCRAACSRRWRSRAPC